MNSITWQEFGPFLRRVRADQGLSQERLAEAIGCHRTYIWRLEHGQRRPSRFLLLLLTRTYVLPIAQQQAISEFEQLLITHSEAIEAEAFVMAEVGSRSTKS